MVSTILLGVGRWYVLPERTVVPFLQLGVGYGVLEQSPQHPDCSVSAGPSLQLGVGLDLSLASWARIGGIVTAHPFAISQSCNGLAYDGRAPDPPFPGLAMAAQVAVTTLWSSR
jgi:hypothetical protein